MNHIFKNFCRLSVLLNLAIHCMPTALSATETLWLKLAPIFHYKDVSITCSASPSSVVNGQLFLGAQINNGAVQTVVLRNNLSEVLTDRFYLDATELQGVELYRDSRGQYWLKKLYLTPGLLNWIFTHADSGSTSHCKLPQPLLTIGPAPYVLEFDIEGLGDSVSFSDSRTGKFYGKRLDETEYRATLRLTQKRFNSR